MSLTVQPDHVVQKGASDGTSQPIIDLFAAENYAKTDGANVNELYNRMNQSDYEQFLVHINFTEPYYLRDAIVEKSAAKGGIDFPNTDIAILDFGCGTGIVGHLIKDAGYTNIWGLDASSKFIEMIQENRIYKGGEALFLGQGVDKFPTKYKQQYDLVTGTGVFLAKHIPSTAFQDAYEALKVGGVFLFTLRANLWETGHELGYKDVADQLVAADKMEYLDHVEKEFWRGREEGIGLFERQLSKILALRKLK